MSLPTLSAKDIVQIGQGKSDNNGVRVVLGAGTGLGVAYLISQTNHHIALAGEGGHASWGATTEQEWFLFNYLKKKFSHVSYERLLSGQGLENIYAALSEYYQQDTAKKTAAQIIAIAHQEKTGLERQTIEQFFTCLGAYAGDLALTLGAFGGVYIAGGIVPRLMSLMPQSHFRAQFENKGRFSRFNEEIPTYVITAEQPGILGAAFNLRQLHLGASYVIP
jgi:glucokinase